MRFGQALMLSSSMHTTSFHIPRSTSSEKTCRNLIFNRHPNALAELIAYFEGAKEVTTSGPAKRIEVDPSWEAIQTLLLPNRQQAQRRHRE